MKIQIPIASNSSFIRLVTVVVIGSLLVACRFLFSETPEKDLSPEPFITFEPNDEPLVFNPASLPDAKVGEPYEAEIQITKNVTPVGDFLVNPDQLPPGLELTFTQEMTDSAVISGTPEKAGTYRFTVSVWCYGTMVNGQTGEKEYTIVVE